MEVKANCLNNTLQHLQFAGQPLNIGPMGKSVIIIDYGSGNLRSAAKAFEKVSNDEGLDFDVKISSDPKDLDSAFHIVLPGQGAFADCMHGLQNASGMIESLTENVLNKAKPFLGICVGMQLLSSRGLEHGICEGLDWIPGEVVPLEPADPSLKIPHMGWNILQTPDNGPQDNRHFILRHLKNDDHVYFVHSYQFIANDQTHVLANTDYGGPVTAIIGRDNIAGVQFHPEKSQNCGLRIISDFLHWKP